METDKYMALEPGEGLFEIELMNELESSDREGVNQHPSGC